MAMASCGSGDARDGREWIRGGAGFPDLGAEGLEATNPAASTAVWHRGGERDREGREEKETGKGRSSRAAGSGLLVVVAGGWRDEVRRREAALDRELLSRSGALGLAGMEGPG